MPSAMEPLRLISAAVSSVGLMLPPLISRKWIAPLSKASFTSASTLLMRPTVVMAKLPRCERTISGWGSVSEMQPMPALPDMRSTSRSNFVRNGEFSML